MEVFFRDVKPAKRIIMAVPSYGTPCGIANYSKRLIEALGGRRIKAEAVADMRALERSRFFGRGDILHIQFEYVLYDIKQLCSICIKAKGSRIPVVVTFHDYARALRDVNSKIIRLVDRVVAHSELMKSVMERDTPGLRNAVVVPIGCQARGFWNRGGSHFDKGGSFYDKEETFFGKAGSFHGKPLISEGPKIGFFGFMAPQKGLVNLVESCAELSKEYPGIRLFIFSAYGKPFEEVSRLCHSEVAEAIRRLDMIERTELNTEYLSEDRLIEYLSGMDLIVLPYSMPNHLGSSMAVRDVMRAGRPIIVTDIPFFSEFRDEVYKIPGNQSDAISEGIRTLLGDEELGRRMLLAARRYIITNSWERSAERHIRIYRGLRGWEGAAGGGYRTSGGGVSFGDNL